MTIVVDTATRIVLLAGDDLTASQIASQYSGWSDNCRPAAGTFTAYDGVTLPTGYLDRCWTYSVGGVWDVASDSDKQALVAAEQARAVLQIILYASTITAVTGVLSDGVTQVAFDITWSRKPTATGYIVSYRTADDTPMAITVPDSGSGSTQSLRISGLAVSTDYYVKIGVNSQWGTIWSNEVSKTTAAAASGSAASVATEAKSTADTAISNAATAQSDATSALNRLNAIDDDDKLTANEKGIARKEWNIVSSEFSGLYAKGNDYGATTEASNYSTSFYALGTFLHGSSWAGSPAVPLNINDTNLSATWDMGTGGGATFRAKWQDYYDKRTALLTKMSDVTRNPTYITETKITGTSVESCYISGNTVTGGEMVAGTYIAGPNARISAALSSGANALTLDTKAELDRFTASGSGKIYSGDKWDGDAISWTGKTTSAPWKLTGVTGVDYAHPINALVVQTSINVLTIDMTSLDYEGTTIQFGPKIVFTIEGEDAVHLGRKKLSVDNIFCNAYFDDSGAANSAILVRTDYGVGISAHAYSVSETSTAIYAKAHDNNTIAIEGYAYGTNTVGVLGRTQDRIGLQGECTGTGVPLRVVPDDSASAPTHTAPAGSFWVAQDGKLYFNSGSGWQLVAMQENTVNLVAHSMPASNFYAPFQITPAASGTADPPTHTGARGYFWVSNSGVLYFWNNSAGAWKKVLLEA